MDKNKEINTFITVAPTDCDKLRPSDSALKIVFEAYKRAVERMLKNG